MLLVFSPKVFDPRQQPAPAPKPNHRDEWLAIAIGFAALLVLAGIVKWMES